RAGERSRRPRKTAGRPEGRPLAGLSKLNSSGCRCRRIPGEPRDPDGIAAITTGAPAAVGAAAFPRKEVIQPQLPLRLPCYDFTPITDATFGRCLPKGWLTDFGCFRLSWCDGRCVQGPGTYSPRRC